MEKEPIYVGNARTLNNNCLGVDIDLGQLKAAMQREDVKASYRKWTDKAGVEHTTMKLFIAPLKNATEYRTHCVKVDTWKKGDETAPRREETVTVPAGDRDDGFPPADQEDFVF